MSNEIDLEQFIQVLDHALATDDPKIRKALKKFLFIAALAMEGDPEPGPFTAMLEEMDDLRRRMSDLESLQQQKVYDTTTWPDYTTSGGTPYWKYIGGSSTSGSSSGNVTITNPSSTSTTISSSSSCGGFTAPSSTSTTWTNMGYTINLGDDEKGKRIKEELKEKLGGLTKSA